MHDRHFVLLRPPNDPSCNRNRVWCFSFFEWPLQNLGRFIKFSITPTSSSPHAPACGSSSLADLRLHSKYIYGRLSPLLNFWRNYAERQCPPYHPPSLRNGNSNHCFCTYMCWADFFRSCAIHIHPDGHSWRQRLPGLRSSWFRSF
jgi:hypothetical protein